MLDVGMILHLTIVNNTGDEILMEKVTQEEHYHGLKKWVRDYQVMRRAGNVKDAIILRNQIRDIINKENLDAERVWGDDPDVHAEK